MIERLNESLEEVERSLTGTVDVAQLARIAATSEYHYRRMFAALAGMPLSEYVRRRRLTVASTEVIAGRRTLLDVALRYGYGSASAPAKDVIPSHHRGEHQHGIPHRREARVHRRRQEGPRPPGLRRREPGDHGLRPRHPAGDERPHRRAQRPGAARHRRRHRQPGGPTARRQRARLLPRGPHQRRDPGRPRQPVRPCPNMGRLPRLGPDAGVRAVPLARDAYGEWFPSSPYRMRPGPSLLRVELADDGTGSAELWLPIEGVEE